MPYTLRKAPKKDAYWVVNKETGRHLSKDPLPKERAKAQMRAVYRAERMEGGLRLGDIFGPKPIFEGIRKMTGGGAEEIRAQRRAQFGTPTALSGEERQQAISRAAVGRVQDDLRRLEAQQTFQEATRGEAEAMADARRKALQPDIGMRVLEEFTRAGDIAKSIADLPGMELTPAAKALSTAYGVARKFMPGPEELQAKREERARMLEGFEARQQQGKEYEKRTAGDVETLRQRLGLRNQRLGDVSGGKQCRCGGYF